LQRIGYKTIYAVCGALLVKNNPVVEPGYRVRLFTVEKDQF